MLGFYLSSVITYIDQASGSVVASLALGSGQEFDALFLCLVILALCYRMYALFHAIQHAPKEQQAHIPQE